MLHLLELALEGNPLEAESVSILPSAKKRVTITKEFEQGVSSKTLPTLSRSPSSVALVVGCTSFLRRRVGATIASKLKTRSRSLEGVALSPHWLHRTILAWKLPEVRKSMDGNKKPPLCPAPSSGTTGKWLRVEPPPCLRLVCTRYLRLLRAVY